jgi:hypothetical protein
MKCRDRRTAGITDGRQATDAIGFARSGPRSYILDMRKKPESEWRVCVIRGAKADEICVLKAISAEAAIKRAIRGFRD